MSLVARAYNADTLEVKAGESRSQVHPLLDNNCEFMVNLCETLSPPAKKIS